MAAGPLEDSHLLEQRGSRYLPPAGFPDGREVPLSILCVRSSPDEWSSRREYDHCRRESDEDPLQPSLHDLHLLPIQGMDQRLMYGAAAANRIADGTSPIRICCNRRFMIYTSFQSKA